MAFLESQLREEEKRLSSVYSVCVLTSYVKNILQKSSSKTSNLRSIFKFLCEKKNAARLGCGLQAQAQEDEQLHPIHQIGLLK